MCEKWMKRALELARNGWGSTSPNPMVGAVIVKNEQLIGEGFHAFSGGPHAEVNALRAAGKEAAGADVYVTLEPCSHYGKTPPCSEALIQAGVKRVFVAMQDPNPIVSGSGIQKLLAAGIEVVYGMLEKEAAELNDVFIHYITHGNPLVIYKAAMSLDGKTATNSGQSQWITGPESRHRVHWIRQRVSAIMVGIGTVLHDNPSLTVRDLPVPPIHPLRVVVDSRGRIPIACQLVNDQSGARTLVATTDMMSKEKEILLTRRGVEVIRFQGEEGHVALPRLMDELGKRKIDSVLLEGGGTLAASALEKRLIHKIMLFVAPKLIGGVEASGVLMGRGIERMADCVQVNGMQFEQIGSDLLITGSISREG